MSARLTSTPPIRSFSVLRPCSQMTTEELRISDFRSFFTIRHTTASRGANITLINLNLEYFCILIFAARCYSSAMYAMAVCLSVCLSVRHKLVFYQNGWRHRHANNVHKRPWILVYEDKDLDKIWTRSPQRGRQMRMSYEKIATFDNWLIDWLIDWLS